MNEAKRIENHCTHARHVRFSGDVTVHDVQRELAVAPPGAIISAACVFVTGQLDFKLVLEWPVEEDEPAAPAATTEATPSTATTDDLAARQAAWDAGYSESHDGKNCFAPTDLPYREFKLSGWRFHNTLICTQWQIWTSEEVASSFAKYSRFTYISSRSRSRSSER